MRNFKKTVEISSAQLAPLSSAGGSLVLATSAIDENGERLSEELLDDLARTLRGKDLMAGNIKIGVFDHGIVMKMPAPEFERFFGKEPELVSDEKVSVLFGKLRFLDSASSGEFAKHVEGLGPKSFTIGFKASNLVRVSRDNRLHRLEYEGPGEVIDVFMEDAKGVKGNPLTPSAKKPISYESVNKASRNPLRPLEDMRKFTSSNPLAPSVEKRADDNPLVPKAR